MIGRDSLAAIRALDDRDEEEREREGRGKGGRERARERKKVNRARPLPYVIGWASGRSVVCVCHNCR